SNCKPRKNGSTSSKPQPMGRWSPSRLCYVMISRIVTERRTLPRSLETPSMQPLEEYLEQQRQRVEVILDQLLPPPDSYPPLLMEAMRYSVFAGGKRLRPILTLAAASS